MSDAPQTHERTEAPTPRRRQQAREKGQVPRSRELATLAVVLAGALGMLMLGPWMGGRLSALLVRGLAAPGTRSFTDIDPGAALGAAVLDAAWTIAPLGALLLVAALAAPVLLGGAVLSLEAARPKLERLDPVAGLRRLFSLNALAELGKTLLKFLVLSGVSAVLLVTLGDELLQLGRVPAKEGVMTTAELALLAFLVLSGGLALVAAADVPYQLWSHLRSLKMTRQEVREELKETEGNPELKARIRRVQHEVARRRMMSEVPRADVVLTNPTHYAVALRYTDRPERAPRVVAKGRGLIAARIRELALEHRVPVCAAPALARAVYFSTKLGGEIPAGLYLAVARVLAYVFELKAAGARGGRPPEFPTDLPVPDELAARGRES
ncbi:MAG TPA: flagellar biosynthesis protein FlhB [Gammaproteobacteria bacterium]